MPTAISRPPEVGGGHHGQNTVLAEVDSFRLPEAAQLPKSCWGDGDFTECGIDRHKDRLVPEGSARR